MDHVLRKGLISMGERMKVWLPKILHNRNPDPPWADEMQQFETEVLNWASEVHGNSQHGPPTMVPTTSDPDGVDSDGASSDSDSSSDDEPEPNGKRKRAKRSRAIEKRAKNLIIQCVRDSMRNLDHRTSAGRNVRESVLAAVCSMTCKGSDLIGATARCVADVRFPRWLEL